MHWTFQTYQVAHVIWSDCGTNLKAPQVADMAGKLAIHVHEGMGRECCTGEANTRHR